ncbi:MAG: hypothetical protein K0V04_03550 [Deltaproteobacteria bacterium]|nr:hypothetical protein [Deltaproteobacteria bacterium]
MTAVSAESYNRGVGGHMGGSNSNIGTGLLGLAVGVGVGLLPPGCAGTMFACSSHDECADGSNEGTCQSSGWCSFEDSSCPSRQRYGKHSGAGLAGTCVPPLDDEGSSGAATTAQPEPDDTTAAPTENTSTVGDPTLDGGTSGSDSTGSVMPETGDTSSGEESTDGGGSETGPVPPQPVCVSVLLDDFDDGMVAAQWSSWQDPGTVLEEAGSMIRFSVVGDVEANTHAGISSQDEFDLDDGIVQIEIADPPSLTGARLYFQLLTTDCGIGLFIEDRQIHSQGVSGPYDATLSWVRMRTAGGQAHVEGSTDGMMWVPLLPPAPHPCDLTEARVLLFGGSSIVNEAGPTAAVSTLEACAFQGP